MNAFDPVVTASPARKARYRQFDAYLNVLELLNIRNERSVPTPVLERLAADGVHLSVNTTPTRAIDAVFAAQGQAAPA